MTEYEPTKDDQLFETRLGAFHDRIQELRGLYDPLTDIQAANRRKRDYALSKLDLGNFTENFTTAMAYSYQEIEGASITPATFVVASATSKNNRADYYCDGVDDQIQINNALTALPYLTVYEGQAVGGGSGYVTLASTVTAEPHEFDGDRVEILAGPGAGGSAWAYTYSDTPLRLRRLYLYTGGTVVFDNTSVIRITRRAGKVVLLDGAYYLSGSVALRNGVTLEGQGPESTVLIMSADPVPSDAVIEFRNYIASQAVGWVTVRGIGVHCHGELYQWLAGIGQYASAYDSSAHHSLIENCNVYHANGWAGIQLYEEAYRTTIRGCRVYGCFHPDISSGLESEGSGIGIVNGDYNIIENCVVSGNEGYGIAVERACTCNIIRNNLVERNDGWGIFVGGEGEFVEGNIVRKNWLGGIYLDDYGGYNTIARNMVRDDGAEGFYGVFIYDDGGQNLVADNDLYLSGMYGAIFNHLVVGAQTTSFGAGNRLNDGSWGIVPDGV